MLAYTPFLSLPSPLSYCLLPPLFISFSVSVVLVSHPVDRIHISVQGAHVALNRKQAVPRTSPAQPLLATPLTTNTITCHHQAREHRTTWTRKYERSTLVN